MASTTLSAYELQRLENIARNQKVLEALGLVRSDAELHEELRQGKGAPKPKRKKEDPESAEAGRAAVRRSMRLAGQPAEEENGPSVSVTREGVTDHTEARAEYDLWSQRWSRQQAGVTVVGTASYAHTLMRVMTMVSQAPPLTMLFHTLALAHGHGCSNPIHTRQTESGLANRIKAIERACGQHAVAKMKLFATILALEGYVELAEDASSAYERLKEKLGEPTLAAEDE